MNSKKLLIVDDSSIFVSRLKRLLQVLPGLDTICEASTYRDALVQLTTPPLPDILLLDINLPDGNGVDLLNLIRQQQSGMIVIMVSNQGTSVYRDLCLRMGANHYVDKSTEYRLLPSLVSSYLSSQ